MRRLGRALGAATVAAVAAGLGATPARANHAPVVTLADPAAVNPTAITGSVTMRNILSPITKVTATFTGPGGSVTRLVCEANSCGYGAYPDANTLDDRLDFSVPVPDSPYNGPVTVTVSASGEELFVPHDGPPATRTYALRRPAVAPTNVRASVAEDRSIVVSWDRVTAHPDTVGYLVRTKEPGGSGFAGGVAVPQPGSGGRVSYTRTDVAAEGGRYEFEVLTVRAGADPADPADAVFSAPASAGATVPPGAPPPTAGAGPAPPEAATPGQIGGFLGDAIRNAPAPSRVTLPDLGFDSTLPFAEGERDISGRLEGDAEEAAGSGRVAQVVADDPTENRRALLLPIAAGAVLCMIALHLRWFAKRTATAGAEEGGWSGAEEGGWSGAEEAGWSGTAAEEGGWDPDATPGGGFFLDDGGPGSDFFLDDAGPERDGPVPAAAGPGGRPRP